jgi:diadenosine tetraphosphate (Ap4A) HIT family hydrolase
MRKMCENLRKVQSRSQKQTSINTSVERGSTVVQTACEFCNEFSGGTSNSFARRFKGQPKTRVLAATRNFRIVPTLGQIVEGYLLVVPSEHYRALADMPSVMLQELAGLTAGLRTRLLTAYGPCVFFEHGTRSDRSGGCGVYHAHLHAVPVTQGTDLVADLKRRFALRPILGIERIGETIDRTDSYLYYRDLESNDYACRVDHLPSQYIRRLLAETLGKSDWDWRAYGREAALVSTITRLKPGFRRDALPNFSRGRSEPTGRETTY